MTAQPQEAKHEAVKAYVFVVSYGEDGKYFTHAACIAGSYDEALAILKPRYADFSGEVSFFGTAVALMEPAMIERWEGIKRIEERGLYSFLSGTFFCKCGDYQKVADCKQEKTRTGWTAYIYNHNHYVRPL